MSILQSKSSIEQEQNRKLQEILLICSKGHPYYQEIWSKAGIDIHEIKTTDDLTRLPLTSKQALMENPERFRIQLKDLPLQERVLWEIIYTTGTTSEPTPFYNTTHDYHNYLFQSKRVAEISGIKSTDVIANLFPLTTAPMGAYVRSVTNAYAAGASIFAALPGAKNSTHDLQRSMDECIHLIESHRATILWGIPSFLRRLLLKAIEIGADFKSVRMCAITGEASSLAMRNEIKRCLKALNSKDQIVFDRYGSTELGAFAQCKEESDWHNPTPEAQFHEIVDLETGKRLGNGERGALAVTHLDRRGTVLIRFVVGDNVSIANDACPNCGRFGDRIVGPVTRAKDLIKVKGMLINPSVLLNSIQIIDDIDEFQVIVCKTDAQDPFSMDDLKVLIATRVQDQQKLRHELEETIKTAVKVTPKIEIVNIEDIFNVDKHAKVQRFIDERK
jgi:phenylacetate-coenzyme A ligase PaaK-like adenylate-forming protein